MRDLFEQIPPPDTGDPTETARRAMRPQLRRRFYERTGVAITGDQFRVTVDDRPVRTPARNLLAAPAFGLAEALADEWAGQGEFVDPAKMPLTRLASTIIDGVSRAASGVTAEVEKYLASDLVLYRADHPEALAERQAAAWDPVLDWADRSLGAQFALGRGLIHVPQPPAALAALRPVIPRDPWRLGAVHSITTLTGSALIALAVAEGAMPVAEAWSAANVDEDWNMEMWGADALALERRAARFTEMEAAAGVLGKLPSR
ncbi:MAG TPA: ATP12 family protein [Xanthobacteraceae bacterium]|jgi:chaperone required for assembly of F1-ATPase